MVVLTLGKRGEADSWGLPSLRQEVGNNTPVGARTVGAASGSGG